MSKILAENIIIGKNIKAKKLKYCDVKTKIEETKKHQDNILKLKEINYEILKNTIINI